MLSIWGEKIQNTLIFLGEHGEEKEKKGGPFFLGVREGGSQERN